MYKINVIFSDKFLGSHINFTMTIVIIVSPSLSLHLYALVLPESQIKIFYLFKQILS
jgi:hypothetical protein